MRSQIMAGKRGRLIEVEAIFGRLLALPDDLITNQIQKFGAHARPELAMLLSMIASGDSVFDLGAHIGTFAIPIAQKVGSTGRVLAVEALPRTFRVLQRNLRKNGVDQIVEAVNALIAPPGLRYAPVRNRGIRVGLASNRSRRQMHLSKLSESTRCASAIFTRG
jgi:hypothetical protein